MAELPDYAVWLVVGAIVAEGFALVILTYLMYRAANAKRGEAAKDAEAKDAPKQ